MSSAYQISSKSCRFLSIFTIILLFSFNSGYSQKKTKSSAKNTAPSIESQPLVAYKADSLWHFLNYTGKPVFAPRNIDDFGGYSEDFFRIQKKYMNKKRWMFLKTDGETVILPECDLVDNFSEGMARTIKILDPEKQTALYGFIDNKGRQIVPIKFDDATQFCNGLAWIMDKEFRGYINTKGKVVFELKDALGYIYSDGMAPISNEKYHVGYIDTAGNLLIDLKYNAPMPFSEGLVAVQKDERYGYMNKAGKQVIGSYYDDVRPFSNGRAFVGFFDDKFHIKWGLIDKEGKTILEPEYDEVREFSEGLAAVRKGALWGFIDTTGKIVIDLKYSYADSFKNGLAWAAIASENKRGFIDKNQKYIVTIPNSPKIFDLRWNRRVF